MADPGLWQLHPQFGRISSSPRSMTSCTIPGSSPAFHDLLGPELIGLGLSLLLARCPRTGTTISWHQDAKLLATDSFKDGDRLAGPLTTLTSTMAVCASSRARISTANSNSAPSDASENNVLDQTVDDVEHYGEIVDVELKAGEVSIHSDLLLHSSHYNESDRAVAAD